MRSATLNRWSPCALALLLCACGVAQQPVSSAPPPELIALARQRGLPAEKFDLVRVEGGVSDRWAVRWRGVRVAGMGGKAGASPSFTPARLQLASEPGVVPRIKEEAAGALALEGFAPREAQLRSMTLLLVPVAEQRLSTDVVGREPTATDFEQVITSLELVWHAVVELKQPDSPVLEHWMVRLDASTGAVLQRGALQVHQKAPPLYSRDGGVMADATLNTLYRGVVQARTRQNPDPVDPEWMLIDYRGNEFWQRNQGLFYDWDRYFGDSSPYLRKSLDSANGQTAAADAFVVNEMTWRMFQNVLGRAGPDGRNRPMRYLLHMPLENATYGPITRDIQVGYAKLDAGSLMPMATMDILGHEIGHDFFFSEAVADPAAFDVITVNEFGALSEATGDVIGTSVEFYASGAGSITQPWSIPNTGGNLTFGEQTGTVFRSMLSPQFPAWSPNLKFMTNFHGLMGPMDREFALLAFGVKPRTWVNKTDPFTSGFLTQGVAGVGMTKALQIWHDLIVWIPEGADFATAREQAIEVAFARFGFGSTESKAVGDTFAAVNIGLAADRTVPTLVGSYVQKPLGVELTLQVTDTATSRTVRPATSSVELANGLLLDFAGGAGGTMTVLLDQFVNGLNPVTLRATDSWGNEGTQVLPVTVDKVPPTLVATISGPGKTPTITVSANDSSGVSNVVFRRNGSLVCDDQVAPYTCDFDTSTWADGNHPISIQGFDLYDNANAITATLVADNTPPVASLSVSGSAPPFTVTATGIDAHPITEVQFTRDGAVYATDSAAPFTASYSPVDGANHTLSARVSDSYGNVGSASATAPKDLVPPTVTATAVQWGHAVSFNVAAADSCGVAFPVKAYVNGTFIGDIPSSPYSFALPTALFIPGTHELALDATDQCGNARHFTSPFDIYVNIPGVAVTVNTANKKLPVLNVQVTHNRPLSAIEVWRGQTLLKTLSNPSNTVAITLDTSVVGWPDGQVGVQVIAIDNIGIPGNTIVNVQVDNTKPTSVSSWSGSGRTVTFQASVSDGFGSGIASVKMGVLNFAPLSLRPPPYVLSVTMPSGFSTADFLYGSYPKDLFGNEGGESFVIRVTCSTTNVNMCTHQRMDF
jgi:hypothetical protein